jgi:vanillate O-demethylase monooxygenase subunit
LLGERYVLVRLSGRVAAFPDACPHRYGPLHLGTCDGVTLACPYHGWQFGSGGRCTSIPALGPEAVIPPKAELSPLAVEEECGVVFVALEPPRVPRAEIPELSSGALVAHLPVVRADVTAAAFIDNFLDVGHLAFVHAGTFGASDDAVVTGVHVERNGRSFLVRYEHMAENHEDALVATGEHPLVQPRRMLVWYIPPFNAALRLEYPLTRTSTTIVTWVQPETATSSRIYTVIAGDGITDDASARAAVAAELAVLTEDLRILEAMPVKDVPLDIRAQVHTGADRASVEFRRVLGGFLSGG